MRAVWGVLQLSRRELAENPYAVWGVCGYENERRAISGLVENLRAYLPRMEITILSRGRPRLGRLVRILRDTKAWWPLLWRDTARIERISLLLTMRQIDFLVEYNYWLHVLTKHPALRPRAVVTSTESNPECIGLALAAKCLGAKQVYVNHGSLAFDLGLFFQDVVVVSNRDLQNKIEARHVGADPKFYVLGQRGEEARVQRPTWRKDPKILIVGSILANRDKIYRALENYRSFFPQAPIVYRPHPNALLGEPLSEAKLKELKVGVAHTHENIRKQSRNFDLILVGHSSAAQEVMEDLKPSFYVDIDNAPYDIYGFIAGGLLPLGSAPVKLEDEFERVYLSSRWLSVLEHYCPRVNKAVLHELAAHLLDISKGPAGTNQS